MKSELMSNAYVRSTVLDGGGWLIVSVCVDASIAMITGVCCRAARDCDSRNSAAMTFAELFTRPCPSVWLTLGIRLATTTKMTRMTRTASKIVKPATVESSHGDSHSQDRVAEEIVGAVEKQCPCRWLPCR